MAIKPNPLLRRVLILTLSMSTLMILTPPLASASIAQVHTARLVYEHKQLSSKLSVLTSQKQPCRFTINVYHCKGVSKVLKDAQRLRPVEVVHEYQKRYWTN